LSTILKALRRLEEEKAATEEPRPLREQIARAPGAPSPRRPGWAAAVFAIAVVLGVGAGGAVIWWLFAGQGVQPEVVAAAPAPPAPVAPPVPAPAAAPPARAPGPPDQAFASDVQTVDRPDALPRLDDSEPVAPGPIPPELGTHRPVEGSAAAERARQAALAEYQAAERARRGLPAEPTPAAPPQPAEPVVAAEPAPAQMPVIAAKAAPLQPAVSPPPPAPEPAPVAQQPAPAPPAEPKAAAAKPKPAPPKPAARPAREVEPPPPPLIAVSVERTQWHPLADRRSAWVRAPGQADAQRVVEGDVVDGAIVSAIEPSGVVFDRNGEKIRRAIGQPSP
jgi:hypothetical protein